MALNKTRLVSVLLILLMFSYPKEGLVFDPQYLSEVVGRQAVSFGDTLKTVMILVRLDEKLPDFVSQKKFLHEQGMLPESLTKKPATELVHRGELAYILFKILRLKGGVKARLFGVNERFAMEELIYQGLMRPGHKLDLVTGQELVLTMNASGQYMMRVRKKQEQKMKKMAQKEQMSDETEN